METKDSIIDVLQEAIVDYFEETILDLKTYEDALVLTSDKGLVMKMHDGSEFQLTLVQSKKCKEKATFPPKPLHLSGVQCIAIMRNNFSLRSSYSKLEANFAATIAGSNLPNRFLGKR